MAADTPIENDTEEVWIPFVEPIPDNALTVFGVWWHIHTLGIGFLWIVIIIYSSVSIHYLKSMKMKQKHYLVALNVIMIILAIDRVLCMFVDPYHAKEMLPPAVAYLFLSLGLPCMTSAFYLIFHYLVLATKVRPKMGLHSPKVVIVIIVSHFIISIALDLAAGFTLKAAELLLTCQGVFITWGYILSIMYFVLFARVHKVANENRKRINQNFKSDPRIPTANGQQKKQIEAQRSLAYIPRRRLRLGARLVLATAVLLFIIATLYLIGIFTIYMSNIIRGVTPEPWPWWVFELLIRLCELALAWTICIAATQPMVKYIKDNKKSLQKTQSYYTQQKEKNKYGIQNN